jgi:hypothetical protein
MLQDKRHSNPLDHTYRIFPGVDALVLTNEALEALSGVMVKDEGSKSTNPAIYTYLGQLIAHDISRVSPGRDGKFVPNPHLDLDTVYGGGYFDESVDIDRLTGRMVLGRNLAGELRDLPRDSRGRAIIPDPRNDENAILSQLQVLFMRLHNFIADRLISAKVADPFSVFEDARRYTTAAYQEIVQKEFLGRLCVDEVYRDVVLDRNLVLWEFQDGAAKVPLEFAGAAFRFGHSMVTPIYDLMPGPPTGLDDLFAMTGRMGMAGVRRLPAEWTIHWPDFLQPAPSSNNFALPIDPKIIKKLKNIEGDPLPLPYRNLASGQKLGLPSGQTVASIVEKKTKGRPFRIKTFNTEETFSNGMYFDSDSKAAEMSVLAKHNLFEHCPLWYYLLAEDWLEHPGEEARGNKLGTLGSLLVSEVVISLIDASEQSIFQYGFDHALKMVKTEFLNQPEVTLSNIVDTLEKKETK